GGTRAFFVIDGDRLVAYDILSGEQRWLVSTKTQLQPVAGNDLLFVVEPDELVARHVEDGSVAWQLPIPGKTPVRPGWGDGWLVLSTERAELLAWRATDGHLVWRRDIKSPAHGISALAADRLYVPTRDRRVVALRLDDGEPIWERRFTGVPTDILASAERVYGGSSGNYLYFIMGEDKTLDLRGGYRGRPRGGPG